MATAAVMLLRLMMIAAETIVHTAVMTREEAARRLVMRHVGRATAATSTSHHVRIHHRLLLRVGAVRVETGHAASRVAALLRTARIAAALLRAVPTIRLRAIPTALMSLLLLLLLLLVGIAAIPLLLLLLLLRAVVTDTTARNNCQNSAATNRPAPKWAGNGVRFINLTKK